jgi:hypothetical protein
LKDSLKFSSAIAACLWIDLDQHFNQLTLKKKANAAYQARNLFLSTRLHNGGPSMVLRAIIILFDLHQGLGGKTGPH